MIHHVRLLLTLLCVGMALLSSCAAGPETVSVRSASVNEQAALEATAIIQRAEATALVLQAQAKATALVQSAGVLPVPATAAATTAPRFAEATRAFTPPAAESPAIALPAATEKAGIPQVELLGVSFAADGRYIYVPFRAPPRVARQWRQGNVHVMDEATGIIYDGIPVAPIIGPLIAQPVHEGQIGYVMLINVPPGIHPGSIVTVVLGDFKQEHITVGGDG
jgi:hypothetical protein